MKLQNCALIPLMVLSVLVTVGGMKSVAEACNAPDNMLGRLGPLKHDEVIEIDSKATWAGMFVKWKVLLSNHDVVGLEREYISDYSSSLVSFRRVGPQAVEAVVAADDTAESPDEALSRPVYVLCNDQEPIILSGEPLSADDLEFARHLRDDFFKLNDIEKYRREFLERN
jgi:hypothetical protein